MSSPILTLANLTLLLPPSHPGVALLLLSRPEKRNAFSQQMITSLTAALAWCDASSLVRCVVVSGAPLLGSESMAAVDILPESGVVEKIGNGKEKRDDGGEKLGGKQGDGQKDEKKMKEMGEKVEEKKLYPTHFCAGMDLAELVEISTAGAHEREFLKDLTDAFARFRKPVVAAVVGFALGGGCEIALACDMIISSPDSVFGLPEIKIGTIPGAGGTQRIASALGKQRAMEFVLLGTQATGQQFHDYGIVNHIHPAAEVVPRALDFAARLDAMSGPVVMAGKKAVLTAEKTTLDAGMEMEKMLYYSTFDLKDCKEGISAFLGKRAPVFEHK